MNAIKTENLTKTFSGFEVIKNCNMNVKKNSIYGFLGPNGAGKSTIFKMLSCLLTPTMGNIYILDMDVHSDRNTILKNIGSIIETPIFYEHLSATENLEIHLDYMGLSNVHIEDTLKSVGLKNTGRQPVSKFSLGMRQRLSIAKAIVHHPKLLILDEPINGLDPLGIREMRTLFTDLVTKHNMTIVISSHILSEIEHIADTIGIIVEGTLVEEITLSEINSTHPKGLEEYFISILQGKNFYQGETKC
jgi:ABC-2 type transport system ATP-binding protein